MRILLLSRRAIRKQAEKKSLFICFCLQYCYPGIIASSTGSLLYRYPWIYRYIAPNTTWSSACYITILIKQEYIHFTNSIHPLWVLRKRQSKRSQVKSIIKQEVTFEKSLFYLVLCCAFEPFTKFYGFYTEIKIK